jgi:hypothetical protein
MIDILSIKVYKKVMIFEDVLVSTAAVWNDGSERYSVPTIIWNDSKWR